jgi:DsbC/DsbD-like thiol-disulfide interchange protein
MMRAPTHIVALLFLYSAALAGAGEVRHTSTSWSGKSPAVSRVILESSEFSGESAVRAGVQIKLDEGWWTYWRAPGASGMPPMFDWSGSENLAGEPETIWPVPLRAVEYGESLNLYRDEVVFPIEFRPADPKKPVKLRLKMAYGVCRNMCVPSLAEHEIVLTPARGAPHTDEANARLISAYSGRRPSHDPFATGLEIAEVRTTIDDAKANLVIRMRGLKTSRAALVLVEGPDFIRAAEITPRRTDDVRVKALRLKIGGTPKVRALAGKRIRITVIDGNRALEQVWVVGAQGSSVAGMGLTPVSRGTERPEP